MTKDKFVLPFPVLQNIFWKGLHLFAEHKHMRGCQVGFKLTAATEFFFPPSRDWFPSCLSQTANWFIFVPSSVSLFTFKISAHNPLLGSWFMGQCTISHKLSAIPDNVLHWWEKKKVLFYKMSDTNLHGLNYLIGNSRPVVQHAITEMPRLFEKKN